MLPDIEIYLELQEIDNKLTDSRLRLGQLKPRAISVQKRLKEETARYTQDKAELLELRKRQDMLRLDIQKRQSDIERYEKQQPMIRTTKEMAALSYELDLSRTQKAQMEDEFAALDDRKGVLEEELAGMEGGVEEVREHCESEIAEIKAEAEEIKTSITHLKKQRAEVLGSMDEELREEFEELSKKYPGTVVANVREGNCLGCNMELIPQIKVELRLKKEVLRCHRCGRILGIDLDWQPHLDEE